MEKTDSRCRKEGALCELQLAEEWVSGKESEEFSILTRLVSFVPLLLRSSMKGLCHRFEAIREIVGPS